VATGEQYRFRNRGKALHKYAGQDVFGSFTVLPKLGINPQSKYNTPIGVYSYPIDYIINNIDEERFTVPFQENAPYLHIFRVSGLERTLRFDLSDNQVLTRYKANVKEIKRDFNVDAYNKAVELAEKVSKFIEDHPYPGYGYDSWLAKLEEETGYQRYSGDPLQEAINEVIFQEGKLGFYSANSFYGWDNNPFPIHEVIDKIYEVVEESRKESVLVEFPFEAQIREFPEARELGDGYDAFKRKVLAERVVCDQGFTWNMTRHLSGFNPRKWTGMFRRLGLIGALDNDTSTIHRNEPTQAVFFNPSSIKVLEVIHNNFSRRPEDMYRTWPSSGTFSVWAEDANRHANRAIIELRADLRKTLKTGDVGFLKRTFTWISWLNQHVDESIWSRDVKDGFIQEIQEFKDSPPQQLDEGFVSPNKFVNNRVLDKLIRMLRRPSR
jgi:hypothetical protein